MSADLTAIGVLAAIGLMWIFVNIRTSRASATKTLSLIAAWAFLLAASIAAARLAWTVLS